VICFREECGKDFEPKTHNQKYCCDECCRTATNQKLKDAYYEKKARLQGKPRTCKTKDCSVILSRYNEGKICDRCVGVKREAERKELIDLVRNVSRKIN